MNRPSSILPLIYYALGHKSRFTHIPKDKLADIDIRKEMELIRQKKSKLSANQRRRIEWKYEHLTEGGENEQPDKV